MLTITPLVAATGLISFDPENWGGSFSLKSIFAVAIFGVLATPLWFTYIPSLILTPIMMEKISNHQLFYTIPYWKFIGTALICGTLCGIVVLSPCIIMVLPESTKLILNWLWAGAISGAVTLTLISLIYRKMGS